MSRVHGNASGLFPKRNGNPMKHFKGVSDMTGFMTLKGHSVCLQGGQARAEARCSGRRLVQAPSKKFMVAWTRLVAVGTESGSWVRTSGELNVKTGEAGIQEDYSSLFLFKHAEMLKLGPFNSSKVQVALI